MAILILKGNMGNVCPVQIVGDKHTEMWYLILLIPGYTDQFGDKKTKDQQWRITVFADKIKLIESVPYGERVECKLSIESVCVRAKEAGRADFYPVNISLVSLDVLK